MRSSLENSNLDVRSLNLIIHFSLFFTDYGVLFSLKRQNNRAFRYIFFAEKAKKDAASIPNTKKIKL